MGDGQKVVTCITGDGTTIDGHGCTCDPRMHDGYSEAFFFEAVPAQIIGIVH
jgi:hypothetical protein